MPRGQFCKINVHCPATGGSKSYQIDEFTKCQNVHGMRISQIVDGGFISPELAGCQLRICGGNDAQGFPMLQGVLKNGRVRLILHKGSKCFRERRTAEPRRKSVRGCIVGPDLHALNLALIDANGKEIPQLTDVSLPKRHAPKRAQKIRRLINMPKGDPEEDCEKIKLIAKTMLSRHIIRSSGKSYYRWPHIRRLMHKTKHDGKHRKLEARSKIKEANRKKLEEYIAKKGAK